MCEIKTIITTAGRPDEESLSLANEACKALNADFIERKKRSVKKIAEDFHAHVIVAGKNRFEYYPKGASAPFFFHPNSAAFRIKRVARGEEDPFLQATNLQPGDTFLDCTLGMASDSILASFMVGKQGKVIGCEADSNVAFLVERGLATYDVSKSPLLACMRNVQVEKSDAVSYLQTLPDRSFDVVYLDPMFEEEIEESTNFEPLRNAGFHSGIDEEWVREAVRVSVKRVVLKAHFRSDVFERFGFQRMIRITSKFHYGVISKIPD